MHSTPNVQCNWPAASTLVRSREDRVSACEWQRRKFSRYCADAVSLDYPSARQPKGPGLGPSHDRQPPYGQIRLLRETRIHSMVRSRSFSAPVTISWCSSSRYNLAALGSLVTSASSPYWVSPGDFRSRDRLDGVPHAIQAQTPFSSKTFVPVIA